MKSLNNARFGITEIIGKFGMGFVMHVGEVFYCVEFEFES